MPRRDAAIPAARIWRGRSRDDFYHTVHVLVPFAAEDVADVVESPGLPGGEGEARHLPGDDLGVQAQSRRVEAHGHVLGAELEDHRHAGFERHLGGRELELTRGDLDYFCLWFLSKGIKKKSAEEKPQERPAVHALPVTGNSVILYSTGFASA